MLIKSVVNNFSSFYYKLDDLIMTSELIDEMIDEEAQTHFIRQISNVKQFEINLILYISLSGI